ncbi:hypothetical protein [Herbidospora cretacea]|uniref:hypothetical protein n=1 Tax=Herbidospora cretacea TaxID=28444 RepID=UPI0004C2D870|nr:hypothetical protein [Herbidospora cretacea]
MRMKGTRVMSVAAAAITVIGTPVAVVSPSAAAAKVQGTQVMAGCTDWTPHIRRVRVASTKVHSSYSSKSSVKATWKYRQLFRVNKRCVNSAGNLWWHSDCCAGVTGYVWNDHTEISGTGWS